MKIYFAGSVRAGRENQEIFSKIVSKLKEYGQVLTEHLGDSQLTDRGEPNKPESEIYERDMAWLGEADVLVAEVSTPSLGVGYEIRAAENDGKPVLCLYKSGLWLSAMIKGASRLKRAEYSNEAEIDQALARFFNDLNK